jgi:hypothetical protein
VAQVHVGERDHHVVNERIENNGKQNKKRRDNEDEDEELMLKAIHDTAGKME